MKQKYSFVPYKCLLYRDHFDGIIERKLKPPLDVDIDPITSCNLKCVWCNSWRVRENKQMIPFETLINLLKELKDWGVKAVCFAGGGEATLYPEFGQILDYCTKIGLQTAIISNGYGLSDILILSLVRNMEWIGVSVDAATPETFKKAKGVDGFNNVINSLKKIIYFKKKIKPEFGVTFKFLIHDLNQYEIYNACKLAKQIGCDSFHVRPVDYLAFQDEVVQLDIKSINRQINKCLKFEDDNFEVIKHFINFDDKLQRKIEFDKCELSSLVGICLPDGWWICIDQKGKKGLKLCELNEIREVWGSKEHFKILDKINPKKDCPKCTFAKYYSNFDVYRNDQFYKNFV